MPELARDIIFADQIDIMRDDAGPFGACRYWVWLARADDMFERRFTRNSIAKALAAVKPRAIDWNYWKFEALRRRLANPRQVVAGQCGDAGVVDEHRRRLVLGYRLFDRAKQPLFAFAHDDIGFR